MSAFTVKVFSEGKLVEPLFGLISVHISKEVNRIPYAELVYADGEIATGRFVVSDSAVFTPGNTIEVKIRYESEPSSEKTLFKGLVILQEVNVDNSSSTLRVVLKDTAVILTKGINHRVFNNLSDAEIIKKILGLNKISFKTVSDTKPIHTEMVQHGCSDWDFIVTRAEFNGLLVVVQDGKVSLQTIESPKTPKIKIQYGINEIYSFNIEANGERQYTKFTGVSWDAKKQATSEKTKEGSLLTAQGNLKRGTIAQKIGPENYNMATTAGLGTEELEVWTAGKLKRNQLSFIRGSISIPGRGDLELFDTIEIKGMGLHFNGKTVVTGIGHRITAGNWTTDIQFGLSDQWLLHGNGVNDLPASGLLPAVSGLQIGKVKKIFENSNGKEMKIQVDLAAFKQETPYLVWARLACPDAGKKRGYYFRPEIEDEVVVGFINDDPRQAIILGSLYSADNNVPHKRFDNPDDKNNIRGIASRKGMVIGFDDEKTLIFIETPGKNTIKLDDKGKTIQVNDQHGNSIVMDKNGISLTSVKDLKLEAKGNVEIKGTKVDIK